MRSWTEASTGHLIMQLGATEPLEGDLWVRALGAGGEIEDDYLLPIDRVTMLNEEGKQAIHADGNVFRAVKLTGVPASAQLRIQLTEAKRYRLGVI